MKITIVYFARLKDSLSLAREELVLPETIKQISDLKLHLASRGGKWEEEFSGTKDIKSAINFDLVHENSILIDNAEVAFFPPVTGG